MPNPPQFPLCQVILCVELPWGQGLLGHSTSEAPCSSKPSPSKSPVALPGMLLRLLLQLWELSAFPLSTPGGTFNRQRDPTPEGGGGPVSTIFSANPFSNRLAGPPLEPQGFLKNSFHPRAVHVGFFSPLRCLTSDLEFIQIQ